MKKLIILGIAVLFVIGVLGIGPPAFAENGGDYTDTIVKNVIKRLKAQEGGGCPTTQMTESCLACHSTPSFKLKEINPHELYDYPHGTIKILKDEKGKYGYLEITEIRSNHVKDFFDYMARHGIQRVVIELLSPGGSLFHGWRIVGLMNFWKAKGIEIETRVHGFALSAGLIVFLNGTKGKRFVSPTAELMWHELMNFKMFDFSSPSDKEDEARVLRHLQDTASGYLSQRSNLTKEEIDQLVHKKEYWVNGRQAIECGMADGLIGE